MKREIPYQITLRC